MLREQLLVHPVAPSPPSGECLMISPETVRLEFMSLQIRKFARTASYTATTGTNELGIVVLGGCCSIESSVGCWPRLGGRRNVFDGLPHALYLPIKTSFSVTAETECEVAFCYSKADHSFPPRLITPTDIEVEVRGGANATRQINHVIKPEFPAHRILIVEVYTPSGNWSSYPPHKHDVHNPPGEVDLEEIYYYKVDRPEGYAIQRVYTADRRIDHTLTVHDGDCVVIPEGYHPVVAAHGYNVYYLNVLAGTARSMAASDDPAYAWVRQTWSDKDPRVPVV